MPSRDHLLDALTALLQLAAVVLGIACRDKLRGLHRRLDGFETRERLERWHRRRSE